MAYEAGTNSCIFIWLGVSKLSTNPTLYSKSCWQKRPIGDSKIASYTSWKMVSGANQNGKIAKEWWLLSVKKNACIPMQMSIDACHSKVL